MKRLINTAGVLLVALFTTAAFGQDGGLSKLDIAHTPRVYADSVSNLWADADSTITGSSIYVGDADYTKNVQVSAYRVGAATNGFNVLFDYSPDGSTWLTGTTVHLDSVGTALEFNDLGADSLYVRGSSHIRVRLKGLALGNDTTDVWYFVKIP